MPHISTNIQPDLSLNDREQIQYLLGNPPSWMMRYGISMMAGCFVLLLGLSYFIRYPDVLEAKITLTTANPPIRVMASRGGRMIELLTKDHQQATKGQVLAVLENTAEWKDVLRLEAWLEQYSDAQTELLPDLHLGTLQAAYSSFSQHWKDYRYFSTNHHTAERIAALEKEIVHIEKMSGSLLRQNNLLKEEFILSTQERNQQKQLHEQKVISDKEFEKSEAVWLQQKQQIESAEAPVLQNQMQVQQLQNQINELRLTKSDTQNDNELMLLEDLQRLRSAVAEWKQSDLIIAPIQGAVSLSKVWSVQQSVEAGAEILAIIPEGNESERIIGKASLAGLGIGKLKPGDRALIRLDAYPAQQYGSIAGKIANISALSQEEAYLLDIELPHSMTTSYKQSIPFRQEMAGQVRIITEDRRVVERIFDRVYDLLKN